MNVLIVGYGGQGVLSLSRIIGNIALAHGYDVRGLELHGLAQRGGAIQCHVKFGKKVYSPMIMKGDADLIIALDALEALRACYYANKHKTIMLVDKRILSPDPSKEILVEQIIEQAKKFAKKVLVVEASKKVKEIAGSLVMLNVFMLGYAIKAKLLPFKKTIAWQVIEQAIPKKFLEQNKAVFEQAFKF